MAVSFTVHHKDLSVKVDDKFHNRLMALFERAELKSNGYITVALSLPKKYGTDAQNRTFHALINEFFLSGCSSFNSVFEMKNYYKLQVAGAGYYIWFDSKGGRHSAEKLEHIPKDSLYVEVPKSWVDFNREQRMSAIDMVIKEGILAGVNTKHWDEIIEGMEDDTK